MMQQDYAPPSGLIAPLRHILRLWRGRTGWLLLGAALSLFSTAAAVGLMTGTGLLIGGIGFPLWALALLGPARVLLRYLERLVTHDATFRALTDLRIWFFRGLAARSGGGLGFRRAGDLLSRLASDVEALDGIYLRLLIPTANALFLLPLLIWFLLLHASPSYAAAIIALFALAAFGVPLLAALLSYRTGHQLSEARSGLLVAATDLAFGLREIRAFGAEPRVRQAMHITEKRMLDVQALLARRGALLNGLWLFCSQAAMLVALAGAEKHPGFAAATVFLLVVSFETVAVLPRAGLLAGHQAAAARRVLEEAGGNQPKWTPPPRPLRSGEITDIAFENVSFRWAADRPLVFEHLWMKVPAGSRIAVMGPSGIGKSTLAALALKVAIPEAGRITLGGVDLAVMSDQDVRKRIAWIGQQTHLFHDTIRANLRLGDPAATDQAMWTALDQAQIGDFVRGLPDGLDHFIGEGGSGFSGGQGRRVALARALLSSAPVLILDEPYAGLDIATAYEFMHTLNALPYGRTLVLITHHLTGAEQLDYMWSISGGQASLG